MKNNNFEQDMLEMDVSALIDKFRGRVLDIVEAQLGSESNWRIIRSQLLNIFGEKGLSGDVQRLLQNSFNGKSPS